MKRTLALAALNKINQTITLKGWVNSRRDHGKLVFLDLRDRSGIVQIVAPESAGNLHPEDVIAVTGTVKKRPQKLVNPNLATGTIEVQAKKITLLAKAASLPFDLSQAELQLELSTLLDNRSLTLRHPKVKAIFKVQETIVQTFRQTMKALGFIEFQAPTIVATATEGGAEIFPVKYFDHTVFLAQSPQFYKQIMVSVFERVFTVAHAYRAEPSVTTRHLTEYIGLDVEFAFLDSWEEIMDISETLIKAIFSAVKKQNQAELDLYQTTLPQTVKKTPRLKLSQAQQIIYQRTKKDLRKKADLDPEGEREICRWAKEEKGSDLVFITHYPTKKRPMYTYPNPQRPQETLSFDLLGRGVEWVTGSQRINDYQQLIKNIKKWGYDPKSFQNPYLQAFQYAMPPEGGFCLGLERLTQHILNLPNVRQACLFPRDMERVDIRLSKLKSIKAKKKVQPPK